MSDLFGSVITGPDLTGVGTPPSNPNWGDHGTWMASLIAGHGHGKNHQDGILGVAPEAKILSIRVITDRTDPGFAKYQSQPSSRGQHELATAIRYAVTHGAGVISMSLGYDAPSLTVRSALEYALRHNVVVVASSGNSGTAQTAQGQGTAPYSFPADYPGVHRGGGGRPVREARALLQRQPVRRGSRTWSPCPCRGQGQQVLAGERDEPGVRADGGRGRADQVTVPAPVRRAGAARDHRVERAPAAAWLRRRGWRASAGSTPTPR